MGTSIGKLLTCDHCGEKVFLKKIKDTYLSGGFEAYPLYEPVPEGWVLNFSYKGNTYVFCPKCSSQIGKLLGKWLDELKEEEK